MPKPKVSIIIPVNNLQNYIRKSLTSVVNQTLKEIEIICVDDGSTDNSLDILKEFAKKDSRITVLEEQTKGQAYARNVGISIAKGEYIGFVDGDDWVDSHMFEKMYDNAKKLDSDIAMCSTKIFDEHKQALSQDNNYYNLTVFDETFDNKTFSHSDVPELIFDINVAVWNKIYKRDFLQKTNARFKEGYIYEDLPFFYETYLKAEKVSLVRDFLYFYRINRFGSTMSNIKRKILDRLDMVVLTFNMFTLLPYYEEIKVKIVDWVISDLFHRYTLIDSKHKREFFFRMKKIFLGLDLKGLDKNALKNIYYYQEFSFVKKESYEDCNKRFFADYVAFKKEKNELISQSKEELYRLNQLCDKQKEVEKKKIEQEFADKINNQKDWYEKELNLKISEQKEWLKNELYNQKQMYLEDLGAQKTLYEDRLFSQKHVYESDLQLLKDWYENEIIYRLNDQRETLKNETNATLNHQKELFEIDLKAQLEQQSAYYEEEIISKLESQKNWFESEIDRRIAEVDAWHNKNLEEQLFNQKEYSDKELSKQKEELDNQKNYYEKEINNVRFILKEVKKLKNVKRKIKNFFIKPKSELATGRPKVSVILPVYNVDKYIRQSLDSLLNQHLKDIEIICVNDGSTDNSANILEEYKAKDSRIKVIHKENAGTGAARNDGLRIATGECIGFVDPDDWVKENMFERLYNLLQEKNVDIVMCTPGGFDEQNQIETDFPYFVDENFKKELDNRIFSWKEISPFSYPMCVWNKLYKKELFDKNNIEFAEGVDFEDHQVIFKSLLTAEKIFFIREKLYIYRFNRPGSILSDNNARLIDHMKIFDIVENILKETNTMDKLRNDFITYKVHNILYYYGMIKEEYKQDYYSKMKESIKETSLTNEETQRLYEGYPELEKIIQEIND